LGPDAKAVQHQLIRALEDRDRNVRKQAGNALLQTGLPERGDIQRSDLGYLRACLRDETATGEIQRWAMKAIAILGENAKAAVAEIGALAKSEDKETRLAAVIALEKFGPVSQALLTDAAKAMKTDDRMYNGRFAMALVKLDLELKTEEGKAAVHVLIGLQKPTNSDDLENKGLIALVADAGKALTNLGKPVLPQVRKAMMTTYRGGSLTVEEELFRATARIAMIRVLEGMGDKAAAAETDLAALETRDPVVQVRVAASNARPKIRR
jgi:HEAT repeat protein